MDDDSGDDGPQTVVLSNVRIQKINFVEPKCQFVYALLNEHQPGLFPRVDEQKKITYAQAVAIFKGRNTGIDNKQSAASEDVQDDPIDLDSVIDMTGYGKDDSDSFYDQACENRFNSVRTLIGVRAECEVTYTPASSGNKRAKVERKRATVVGEWPVLSDAVTFEVVALQSTKLPPGQTTLMETVPLFEALGSSCTIAPQPTTKATIADFHKLLVHHSMMHTKAADEIVKSLFPRAFNLPDAGGAAAVRTSLVGPDGGAVDTLDPLTNTFDISELITAIDNSRATSWLTIDHTRTFFQTATMFFYPAEVRRIFRSYPAKSARDIVSRGRKFVIHMNWLLQRAPHILNIKKLKYLETVTQQTFIRANKKRLLTQRDQSRLAIAQLDFECAAMRGLLVLPDRELVEFRESLAESNRLGIANVLPADELAVVTVALDFYTLMLHDQAVRNGMYANEAHKRRVEATEHGVTSGHMFTVIDSIPRSAVVNLNSSSAMGSVCIDDWPATQSFQPAPTAQPLDVEEDDPNSRSLSLPTIRTPTPATASNRVQSTYDFTDTIARLASPCTPEQLVAAIRWLIDKTVVTRVPMIGSGPRNDGRVFDAYYVASVHSAQTRVVNGLMDIYKRGIAAALQIDEQKTTGLYNKEAAITAYREKARAFRDKIDFFSRARDYLRTLSVMHATQMAANKTNAATDLQTDMVNSDAQPQVLEKPTESSLLACAKTLHSQVMAFVAGEPSPLDPSDPYVDLLPIQRSGERTLTFGLLTNPEPPVVDETMVLCAEQVRAIKRAEHAPIIIEHGRAGTGKSEVLRHIINPFVGDSEISTKEQVMVCAFTGKVVSELTRRLGVRARTMHSLIFSDVLHKQEVKRCEGILSSLEARVQYQGHANSEFEQIVRIRRELYNILGVSDHRSPFENVRVLVIDEGSLMPFSMLDALITAMHDYQKRSGNFLARVVICGDPWQLPPISYGSVLPSLIRAFPWCVQHMTINHRSEGDAIFKLANDIAHRRLGKAECPLPIFGGLENERKLRTPTNCMFTGNETNEERAQMLKKANDASVVFIPALWDTLGTATKSVFELLGAVRNPPTPESIKIRDSILVIASTRATVTKMTEIVRSLMFAQTITDIGGEMQLSNTGEVMMPPRFRSLVLPGDRVMLNNNWHQNYLVPYVPDDDDEGDNAVCASVLRLQSAAYACGLSKEAPAKRVMVSFYNGELLKAEQFYDEPGVITGNTYCRCGLCPAQPPRATGEPAPPPSHCVTSLHEVPIGRRATANMSDPFTIKYHTQNMQVRDGMLQVVGGNMRRKAVFRLVNSSMPTYKEVDVGRRMSNLSQFSFAWAATIHKIQGSEAPIVIYVCTSDSVHINWSAVYTAVTRPRQRLIIVGDPRTFRSMIDRQPSMRRCDMWAQLAIEANSIHKSFHRDDDPMRIARALNIDDPLTMRLVDTRRDVAPLSRREMWAEYDPLEKAALARGEEEIAE